MTEILFCALVDPWSDQDVDMVRALFEPDESFTYLEYSSTEIRANGKDWKLYGSPVSPALQLSGAKR